jgi:hypothetical protein
MKRDPSVADLRSALIAIRDGARNLMRLGWPIVGDFDQILKSHAQVLTQSYGLRREIDAIRIGLSVDCQIWEKVYGVASQDPKHPELRDALLVKGTQRDGSPQRIVERCDALLVAITDMR